MRFRSNVFVPLFVAIAAATAVQAQDPSPQVLTLSEAVRRTVETSPISGAARDRVAAAAGAARQASRLPNPVAEVRVENWNFHADRPTPRWDNIDFFATLTQPLELGPKRSARAAEAAAAREASASEADRTRHEVTLETARCYLAAFRASFLAGALEESRESLSEIVAMMGRRVSEGWSAEADLLRFRAELARAEQALLRVRLERDRELRLLAALLGEPAPVATARLVPPALPGVPEGDAESLARSALERRPEVSLARARVAQAREAARLEKARRVPTVGLTAGYERSFGLDTGTAAIVIPLPLFDANAGNIIRAEAEERSARAELAAVEARFLAGGAARIEEARELRARALTVEEDLVRPADGAREAASVAFREGASDVLRLLDAQRLFLDARREALDLAADAILSAADVRLSLGEEAIP